MRFEYFLVTLLIDNGFLAKAITYSYDVGLTSLKVGINGDYTVKSSDDFVAVAKEMEIEVKLVNTSLIQAENNLINLGNIVKNSKKILNIKKLHYFEVQRQGSGKKKFEKIVGHEISPKN